jgi:NitT/TauT family transport system substrate-binding protein
MFQLRLKYRDYLSFMTLVVCLGVLPTASAHADATELPRVRIAHGAFNEKVAALWLGAEQGFFQKHGVDVEIVNVLNGPQTIHALTSGEVQMAYTIPGSVLSAAASGIDAAFFASLVSRADGEFIVAPSVRAARDLKGKRLGVQSVGGGVWTLTMLAIEHLGLDLDRDNIWLMMVGDQPVLTRSLAAGRIEGA